MARKRRDVESGTHAPPSAPGQGPGKGGRDDMSGARLRFREGQPVAVDVHNDTDTPELVHWHGQMNPSDVDDAAEEGTPFVPSKPASARRRL